MSKVIMYHYIRYKDNEFPNFKFLHKKNFLKQLSYFEKKNNFLKIGDNFSNFNEKNNKITLTFDDGLKEHFEVAKHLYKKNILGFFFIPTYPYLANDFINPHKLHLILGKYHVDEVAGFLKKILKNLYIMNSKKFRITSKDVQMKATKNEYDKKVLMLKKKLNYLVKDSSKIIGQTFNHFIKKNRQKKIFKNFYLNLGQIKEMDKMGMCIGSHSHSHQILNNLDFKKQALEIKKSKEFLNHLLKKKINHFCFPYGGKESYNRNTIKILNRLKFDYSFTVENKSVPKKINYLEIPRIDCNKFIFGKSS